MIVGAIDGQLVIQAAAALNASGNGAALDLGEGFAPGGVGMPMAAVVDVTAVDTTTGDETYALKVQDSPDNATFTDRSVSVTVTAAGVVTIPAFVTARYVRLVRTLAGTTPILTVADSYLTPLMGA